MKVAYDIESPELLNMKVAVDIASPELLNMKVAVDIVSPELLNVKVAVNLCVPGGSILAQQTMPLPLAGYVSEEGSNNVP